MSINPHKIKAKVIGYVDLIDGQSLGFVYDVHLFSSQPTMTESQFLSLAMQSTELRILFGGDNVDLRNCLDKDLPRARGFMDKYKRYLWKPETEGNHDGTQDTMRQYIIIRVWARHDPNVLLRTYAMGHGCWESDPTSMYNYRGKAKGCSWFKWKILRNIIEFVDYMVEARVKKAMLVRCFQTMAELNVDHVIVGHKHPSELMTEKIEKGLVFLMPRGLTTMVM